MTSCPCRTPSARAPPVTVLGSRFSTYLSTGSGTISCTIVKAIDFCVSPCRKTIVPPAGVISMETLLTLESLRTNSHWILISPKEPPLRITMKLVISAVVSSLIWNFGKVVPSTVFRLSMPLKSSLALMITVALDGFERTTFPLGLLSTILNSSAISGRLSARICTFISCIVASLLKPTVLLTPL